MGDIVSTKYEGTTPLSIGDLVSFSYLHTTKDSIPVDIKISHIRHDISWLELMRHGNNEDNGRSGGNMLDLSRKLYHQINPRKEYGFWTQSESKNIKDF